MSETDTIAAIATVTGKSAIGVVKVSGPSAGAIASIVTRHKLSPRKAHYLPFFSLDGSSIDEGIAIFFNGPDSYTGEDVLELHAHGNPFVLDQLVAIATSNGARNARPGEFTERAFLNDKLDLAQAEAVADLIESNSIEAARASVRSLSGEFSKGVTDLLALLVATRVYVEAALDFSDEEIDFLQDDELTERLLQLQYSIENILGRATQGCLMQEGFTVVIAGEPNVGKSSVLNRLTGEDTAIVTDVAGTTRDVLRENISIDGLPLHIVDTAGLRETNDAVEIEGIRRAYQQIEQADLILAIQQAGQDQDSSMLENLPEAIPVLWLYNKCDLVCRPVHEEPQENVLLVSAKTGEGFEAFVQKLKDAAGYTQTPEGAFMARRRHIDALQAVHRHVAQAEYNLRSVAAGELAAEELRMAQMQLNQITGEFSSDDLLGEIFGSFCIGK
ncbi:tRNA uridine-5-carboxymethylaminomethyl(34) synthesis GTPase MnmE [Chromatiales bacterium (ex Bugula neritina AB1)]|nr:tRNA uridine-5-carboxymethylaminomethyl(34) synthesis GTPase MnmE [Chromatiales bacterium (ex Bugula neritina AB1)]